MCSWARPDVGRAPGLSSYVAQVSPGLGGAEGADFAEAGAGGGGRRRAGRVCAALWLWGRPRRRRDAKILCLCAWVPAGRGRFPLRDMDWAEAGELDAQAHDATAADRPAVGDDDQQPAGESRRGETVDAASGLSAGGLSTTVNAQTVDGLSAEQLFRAGPRGSAAGGVRAGTTFWGGGHPEPAGGAGHVLGGERRCGARVGRGEPQRHWRRSRGGLGAATRKRVGRGESVCGGDALHRDRRWVCAGECAHGKGEARGFAGAGERVGGRGAGWPLGTGSTPRSRAGVLRPAKCNCAAPPWKARQRRRRFSS